MSTSTITEFLEARIAEDEAQAYNVLVFRMIPGTGMPGNQAIPDRVLAECAAKRAILAEHEMAIRSDGIRRQEGCVMCNYNRDYGWEETGPCKTLRALAAVYASHPDYRQEWAL